jgi:hypothetical protein
VRPHRHACAGSRGRRHGGTRGCFRLRRRAGGTCADVPAAWRRSGSPADQVPGRTGTPGAPAARGTVVAARSPRRRAEGGRRAWPQGPARLWTPVLQAYSNLAKCVLDATQFLVGQFRPRGVVVGNANGRVEPVIHVRCRSNASSCAPLVPPPRSSPQTYPRAPGGQVLLSPGCSRLRRGGAEARSGRASGVLPIDRGLAHCQGEASASSPR